MAKKTPGRPFEPGQSGNPGGRPKTIGLIRDLAREHSPTAITTLVTIMNDGEQPAASRVAAAREVLDRGWGKPAQVLTGDEEGGGGPLRIIFSTTFEEKPEDD